MREIKFRAWDAKLGRFHYFDCNVDHRAAGWWEMVLKEKMPVTQWTGLKDKKGIEIYADDILEEIYLDNQEEGGIGKVRLRVAFNNGSFGWLGEVTGKFHSFASDPFDYSIVIGNIYEQPQLLKP